ncbi:MAG: endonuclease/exonuclease/phosphatase family protein [Planctomycetota bacterium]
MEARSLARRAIAAVPAAIGIVALAAAAVRIALRDHVDILSVLFYAFPPAVLLVAFAAAGLGFLARRRFRTAALSLAAAVACFFWWRATAFVSNSPDARPADLRVLHWNVSYPEEHWPVVAAKIRTLSPDFASIAELWKEDPVPDAFWREQLPGYSLQPTQGRFTLATKWPVEKSVLEPLGGRNVAKRYLLDVRGRRLWIILVDFASDPLVSRRASFESLRGLLAPLDRDPVLLMGDFNTPADSAFLDPFRARYRNAFETAGRGCTATWPMPFPVLSIDQIWANRAFIARRCEHGASILSDHRWVFAEFSLPAAPERKDPPRAP